MAAKTAKAEKENKVTFLTHILSGINYMLPCVVDSAVAGALSMFFGCSVMAPFGGVFILPLNSNIPGYVISLAAGIFIGTILLGLLKKKPE